MEMIKRFERELRMSDISEKTISYYTSDLIKFFEYAKKIFDDSAASFNDILSLVDYMFLEDYRNHLEDEEYSRATINRVVMSLRSFFNYYSKYTGKNPSEKLRGYKKVNNKEKKLLTTEEVALILKQTQEKKYGERFVDFNSARDRFLISLLASTGLRVEEALSIQFKDIDTYDGYKMININCHEGATKLNKRIPLCGKALEYYNDYMMEYEKKFDAYQDSYLIVSPRSGKKITTKDSNLIVKKYAYALGIDEICNHCFRHFCNVRLMAVGTSDTIRNKILGWSTNDMGSTVYFHNSSEIDKIMVEYCGKILL